MARHFCRSWVGMRFALVLSLLAAVPAAADERWIASAEAPLAVPVSAAQRDRFGVGSMPAVAVYRSLAPWALVGARLRVGLLSDGAPPPSGMSDPGTGGFGSLSLALRLRPAEVARRGSGPWIEVAAGAGLTGHDLRPAWEAGVGWGFAVGSLDVGPSVRVLRVEDSPGPMDPGSAMVGLVGIEIAFLDASARPKLLSVAAPVTRAQAVTPPPPPEPAAAPPPPEPAPDPRADADGDGIADGDDACPHQAETMNGVEDADGCPDVGTFVVENDRIVLAERVLFDWNRARVKHGGARVLEEIAALWHQHPDWDRIVVEGHADVRGSDAFNDWLSRTRAERVKAVLLSFGFRAEQVEAIGYGKRRPRDPGQGEAAHQKNRRVEFVIVKAVRP